MLAVGEPVLGRFDEAFVRMSTGFGGGVGQSREELCGALSAGVMLIGGMHGRALVGEDKEFCNQLVSRYRQRFKESFGSTNCGELRRSGYGADGHTPCSELVAHAASILLEVLEEA